MRCLTVFVAPGPEYLSEEEEFYWGVRHANNEFEATGSRDALFFDGLDSDGYAIILGKFEGEPDLTVFETEAMIPLDNVVSFSNNELSFEQVVERIHYRQKNFRYFSPSAARRMIGDAFTADSDGYDYDYETEDEELT